MKKILSIVLLLLMSSSYAEFYQIEEKRCDGEELALKNGERIYLDMDKRIIGLGRTFGHNDRIVDFNTVVITGFNGITMGNSGQTNSQYSVKAVSTVRKTNLDNNLHELANTSFEMALVVGDELSLTKHEDCIDGVLAYKLKM